MTKSRYSIFRLQLVLTIVFLGLGVVTSQAQQHALADSGMTVQSLAKLKVSDLMRSHPGTVRDTITLKDPRTNRLRTVIRFFPVTIARERSILELEYRDDSVLQADAYFPFTSRSEHPEPPYGLRKFVTATAIDLDHLRNRLTNSLGEPSVVAETAFLYLGSPELPHIGARLEDKAIHLTVSP